MTGRTVEFEKTIEGMAGVLHLRTRALRALAIVPTMMAGVREVVHDGHRCRVCARTWKLEQPEQHQDWCALKGTEQ